MSDVGPEGRSYKTIRMQDLERLAAIATADLEDFFSRYPGWAARAALHMLNGQTGVNDFDIYAFFSRHPDRAWFARRNKTADFGDPRFGQSGSHPHFVGRRVDLMGRSISPHPDADPAAGIQEWLRSGSGSAHYLSRKAVVLLTPTERMGEVIWPIQGDSALGAG